MLKYKNEETKPGLVSVRFKGHFVAVYGRACNMIKYGIITQTREGQVDPDVWVVVFRDGELFGFATSEECRDKIETYYYRISEEVEG